MNEGHKDGRTILVVEDHEETLHMMRKALEMYGYNVVIATNGQEAVEVALRDHPDLILMDLWLPQQTGIAAMQSIRQNPEMHNIPIVAVTAYEAVGLDLKAIETGCADCLIKPIDLDQLKRVLDRLLPVKTNVTHSDTDRQAALGRTCPH